mmetsp:Transcript_3785/g.12591  ORF Transcript_3785/g.12591 Transcript_3785/m.12591 type:complete len:236 (+) Transcript_3785:2583-3290(+)
MSSSSSSSSSSSFASLALLSSLSRWLFSFESATLLCSSALLLSISASTFVLLSDDEAAVFTSNADVSDSSDFSAALFVCSVSSATFSMLSFPACSSFLFVSVSLSPLFSEVFALDAVSLFATCAFSVFSMSVFSFAPFSSPSEAFFSDDAVVDDNEDDDDDDDDADCSSARVASSETEIPDLVDSSASSPGVDEFRSFSPLLATTTTGCCCSPPLLIFSPLFVAFLAFFSNARFC